MNETVEFCLMKDFWFLFSIILSLLSLDVLLKVVILIFILKIGTEVMFCFVVLCPIMLGHSRGIS